MLHACYNSTAKVQPFRTLHAASLREGGGVMTEFGLPNCQLSEGDLVEAGTGTETQKQ